MVVVACFAAKAHGVKVATIMSTGCRTKSVAKPGRRSVFPFCRPKLLDRQVGRLSTFEYLVHIRGEPVIDVRKARAIEHQPAGIDELAPAVDRRQPVFHREFGDQLAVRLRQRFQPDDDGFRAYVNRSERTLDVVAFAHVEQTKRQPLQSCGPVKLPQLRSGDGIAHVQQGRNSRATGSYLRQQFEPLGFQFGLHAAQPGDVAALPRKAVDDQERLADGHDHGNCPRRLLDGERSGRAPGHDQIDLQADQVGDEGRKPRGVSVGGSILEYEVASFCIAKLL